MQIASSSSWTRVTPSISYNDNNNTICVHKDANHIIVIIVYIYIYIYMCVCVCVSVCLCVCVCYEQRCKNTGL